MVLGFARVNPQAALAVSVQVIFAFFRKKFDGAQKPFRTAGLQCRSNVEKGKLGVKQVGFPAEFLW